MPMAMLMESLTKKRTVAAFDFSLCWAGLKHV